MSDFLKPSLLTPPVLLAKPCKASRVWWLHGDGAGYRRVMAGWVFGVQDWC